jgi:hypothetical protein
MATLELHWSGPFAFLNLLGAREHYTDLAGPGVYVHLRRASNGAPEYLYVGRASGRPGLMERQVRHYVGSVGLLYYVEPKLTQKGTPPVDFDKAVELLRNRAKFKERVDRVFEEMDSQLVYLAKCTKADAAVAESALIAEWKPRDNRRHERAAARVQGGVTLVHLPAAPGTE